ncbi:HigA family addiction module antitoxin [Candidatus Halobeggiatoa sp. HSG11]|nr:HigA family addiction module antitoxin [Candidatus Halobeggiatoa sp. HSG11]
MSMQHNPPHPGEFIKSIYMEPYGISCRNLAEHLGVSTSIFSRIINEKGSLSPEMALRLSKVLGRTPESWLIMQDNFELWQIRNQVDLSGIRVLDFTVT